MVSEIVVFKRYFELTADKEMAALPSIVHAQTCMRGRVIQLD
jgi:hypothetical protein